MTEKYRDAAVDAISAAALAKNGLRLASVNTDDEAEFTEWLRAEWRGFYESAPGKERLAEARTHKGLHRSVGVYDDTAPHPTPVGTVATWLTELTLPGHTRAESWAISSVTVAPTHRRRGIATSLLEGELRTAHTLGLPLAILTVSESVIYGRWGFGPATFATSWSVDTTRAKWNGGETPGRLSFTDPDSYRQTAKKVLNTVSTTRVGEISMELDPGAAEELIGPLKGDDDAGKHRLVRYDSPENVAEGFMHYSVEERADFAQHLVEVHYLAATSERALRALWRFVVELDLVSEVRATLRACDEPLRELVSDMRAAHTTAVEDHLWVRILDVPAALMARRYESDGEIVLNVTDAQQIANGRFRLTVVDGKGHVAAVTDAADIDLPISSLGSILLGHPLARNLALSRKISGTDEAVATLDRLFRTVIPPRLSVWF